MMEPMFGVPAQGGLAMWVADMDFRPPACVQTALEKMLAHGIYGYFGDDQAYLDAITWWMQTRHGWSVDPKHIFTIFLNICLINPNNQCFLLSPLRFHV